MILLIRNLLRKLRGKPPITNLYFKECDRAVSDIFSDMASRHKEVVMVYVQNSEDPELADVKCFAKISDESAILSMLPVIIQKIQSQQNEQS